jgi:hypothetical protein
LSDFLPVHAIGGTGYFLRHPTINRPTIWACSTSRYISSKFAAPVAPPVARQRGHACRWSDRSCR